MRLAGALVAIAMIGMGSSEASAQRRTTFGSWDVELRKDEFTDITNVVVSTYVVTGRNTGLRGLAFRCLNRKTSMILVLSETDPELTEGEALKIDYRVDGGSVRQAAGFAAGKRSVGVDDIADAQDLIQNVIDARRIALRFPAKFSKITAVFDVRETRKALRLVAGACQFYIPRQSD